MKTKTTKENKVSKKKTKKKPSIKTKTLNDYSIFDLVKDNNLSEEDKLKIIEQHDRLNTPAKEYSSMTESQEIYNDLDPEQKEREKETHIKDLKKQVGKKYNQTNIILKIYNRFIAHIDSIFQKKEIKEKVDINNLFRVNTDKIILKKGQKIVIKGIPVKLETDILVSGNRSGISLTNTKKLQK